MLLVSVIGNLGADAIVREENGRKYVTFRVAHTERFRRSDGREVNNTTWLSCYINNEAESLLPYLTKGTKVFVMGSGTPRFYTSVKARGFVASIDVNVRQVELVGGVRDDIPPRLYDSVGHELPVYKAFYITDESMYKSELYDKHGQVYYADHVGFITRPTQGAAAVNNEQAHESDTSNNEVY